MSASVANEDRAAVGRRIGQARRERGLTQADLATRIGVTLGLVDRYESGKSDPSGKLAQIAEVTGRRISWFTERDEVQSEDSEAELPAALGLRIAESRVQRGITRQQPHGRPAAAHDEPGSRSPRGHPSPQGVDRPHVAGIDVADIDREQPDEGAALARRRDELQAALDAERRKHAEAAAQGERLEHELNSVEARQRALADALQLSGSELAGARAQEAQLVEQVSQLETRMRAAEEHAAEAAGQLARAETELQRSRERERSMAEEIELLNAELSVRWAELDKRVKALARAQTSIDDRRRDGGDVEPRAAAVGSPEEAAGHPQGDLKHGAAVVSALERRLGMLRPGKPTSAVEDPRSARADEHFAIVRDRGYRLVRRHGRAPDPGEIVELEDVRYRCVRINASPFPGDHRLCAVLEAVIPRSGP